MLTFNNKSIQLIAEVKTKSPFGYVSDKTWDELFAMAEKVGDMISIHTDARWGGSFDLLKKARSLTKKPILAKGIHETDELITKAIESGADFVLVVGRMPSCDDSSALCVRGLPSCDDSSPIRIGRLPKVHLDKCLIEPNTLEELRTIPKNLKVVWNSRDLTTGGLKKETFAEARKIFPGWLCQASNIETVADIAPGADAVLVGTKLIPFAESLSSRYTKWVLSRFRHMNTLSSKTDWKLKQFYYVTQVSGLVVIFLIALSLLYVPAWLTFLGDPQITFFACAIIFCLHGILFYLQEHFQKKAYYTISRYAWLVFFLTIVYVSGGIQSQVIFLLIFPLLASVVDLDAQATKVVGILSTLVFGSFIFFDISSELTYTLWTQHIFNTVLLGTIAYYAYQIVDNTLRQKYERDEAQRKLNEMVEIDQLKTDFLTVASHQLRNPLTASRWGFEEVMTHKDLPQDVQDTLKISFGRIEEAIGIVNEMLKTAELGSQGLKLKLEKIDFVTLAKTVTGELGHLSIATSVPVDFKTTMEHLFISGDYKLLLPALMNIVDNAIRYSPKGKVSVSVSQNQSGDAVLQVVDTGIGIPESVQQYIFQRLYRAPNAISVDPNESGVGLYSTKKIVELHKGAISFASILGKGTTFTVTIPTVN